MNRTIIFIITTILLIGGGVGVYIMLITKHQQPAVIQQKSSFPTARQEGSSGIAAVVDTNAVSSTATSISSISPESIPRFVKITSGPVATGLITLDSTSTPTVTHIRYIERKSGNMYDYNSKNKILTRITNKTIPGVERVSWLSNGSMAYLQYFSQSKSLETYALSSNKTGGFSLSQNISSIATHLNNALLTLDSGVNGSIATRLQPNGSESITAFQTPLSKISAQFTGDNSYLVYTKPSGTLNGYAFTVDKTGVFTRIAGPLKGLAAQASPTGKRILVSYVDSTGTMHLRMINTVTHTTTPLPVSTIADKCVWAYSGKSAYCAIPTNPTKAIYPDDWYQGAISFNDSIWQINITNHYAKLVLSPTQEGKSPMDIISLSLDPDETTLSFINKKDGSLWSFHL